jgi:hypothetical protein
MRILPWLLVFLPALPLTNWLRLATNKFDANGSFVVTNSISKAPLLFL